MATCHPERNTHSPLRVQRSRSFAGRGLARASKTEGAIATEGIPYEITIAFETNATKKCNLMPRELLYIHCRSLRRPKAPCFCSLGKPRLPKVRLRAAPCAQDDTLIDEKELLYKSKFEGFPFAPRCVSRYPPPDRIFLRYARQAAARRHRDG